jgi:3-hydroxybutyryl-CoA dehydratase
MGGGIMSVRYYDEINIGEEYRTPGVTVTEYHIGQFAGLSMDFWELHTNEEFAKGTQFGRRVAHGLLGLALTDGLKNRSEFQVHGIGALHWSWNFVSPIFLGDTVHVQFRVAEMRPSKKKPNCGIVTLEMKLINQRGEVTQRGRSLFMVERRGES